MRILVLIGYYSYKVYQALLYVAQFLSAIFIIVAAVLGIQMLIEGYQEMKLDRKQRELRRKTEVA